MTDKELLDRKRKEAANKIKSVAPHVDMLINMQRALIMPRYRRKGTQ